MCRTFEPKNFPFPSKPVSSGNVILKNFKRFVVFEFSRRDSTLVLGRVGEVCKKTWPENSRRYLQHRAILNISKFTWENSQNMNCKRSEFQFCKRLLRLPFLDEFHWISTYENQFIYKRPHLHIRSPGKCILTKKIWLVEATSPRFLHASLCLPFSSPSLALSRSRSRSFVLLSRGLVDLPALAPLARILRRVAGLARLGLVRSGWNISMVGHHGPIVGTYLTKCFGLMLFRVCQCMLILASIVQSWWER